MDRIRDTDLIGIGEETKVEDIKEIYDVTIPGIETKIIKISDPSLALRKEVVQRILDIIFGEEIRKPEIWCLIPEGLVSLIIGAKGRQIKELS